MGREFQTTAQETAKSLVPRSVRVRQTTIFQTIGEYRLYIDNLHAVSNRFLVSFSFLQFLGFPLRFVKIKYCTNIQQHTKLQVTKLDPRIITTIAKLRLYNYNRYWLIVQFLVCSESNRIELFLVNRPSQLYTSAESYISDLVAQANAAAQSTSTRA